MRTGARRHRRVAGRDTVIADRPGKVRPVERPHLQADVSRLEGLMAGRHTPTLRRGLADLLAAEPIG